MSHERTLIRNAVIAQLKGTPPTWRTIAHDRVYPTRMGPVREHTLPVVCVYVTNDAVDPASKSTGPRVLTRTAKVAIEGWISTSPGVDIDAALDDLALQIETAMDLDLSLDRNATDALLTETQFGFKAEGSRPMACVHLEFDVSYYTDLRVADQVDDFDVASITYNLSDSQLLADRDSDLVEDIHE